MAYTPNELVSAPTDVGAHDRIELKTVLPKTLANAAGGPTLARLTPMAFNTSTNKWVAWTNGGTNGTGTISGFLMDEAVLDATDDVLAQMILEGKIHHDDVPVPSGETQNNLTTALKVPGLREKGIHILGIGGVA